jgi:hypothetical protein
MTLLDSDKYKVPAFYASDDAPHKLFSIIQDMATFYKDLTDAKIVISTYIIYYETAEESLNYAIIQFEKGRDYFNENIEDKEHKENILKDLQYCINQCKQIKDSITSKIGVLSVINAQFSRYLERVIDINERANSQYNSWCLLQTPVTTYY